MKAIQAPVAVDSDKALCRLWFTVLCYAPCIYIMDFYGLLLIFFMLHL